MVHAIDQTLAIDPGRNMGWALFTGPVLVACGLARWRKRERIADNLGEVAMDMAEQIPGAGADFIVVERMVVYPDDRKRSKQSQTKSANDVLDLQALAFYAAGVLTGPDTRLSSVAARTWKGQTPKDIMERRIKREVADRPRASAEALALGLRGVPASLQHNTVDAVGIGLWFTRGRANDGK